MPHMSKPGQKPGLLAYCEIFPAAVFLFARNLLTSQQNKNFKTYDI